MQGVDLAILSGPPSADKDAHPFTYCMEHVVPAIEDKHGPMDDAKAFCGWWKAERAAEAVQHARSLRALLSNPHLSEHGRVGAQRNLDEAEAEAIRLAGADWDESLHPRDPAGKFTKGGDEGDAEVGGRIGIERRPVFKTTDVDEAVDAMLRGEVVELDTVARVHTLLDKLGKIAIEAKAKGEKAPNYDLCKVTVPKTNLFCEAKVRLRQFPEGIKRIEMPQLGGEPVPGSPADKLDRTKHNPKEVDGGPAFVKHLQEAGFDTKTVDIPAYELKASQSELGGTQVGSMMNDPKFQPEGNNNPIYVSRDGYIIDGHHRWAATVGRDMIDGKLGDLKMRAVVIDAPITELLPIAEYWSQEFGIKPKAVAGSEKKRAAAANDSMRVARAVTLVTAAGAEIRSAMLDGVEHYVVPVVALVEGVIHAVNAPSPELVLAEEFSNGYQGWNGRPIVPDHPTRHGVQVSANDPDVYEAEAVGMAFNARVAGKRLEMEAWINPSRAMRSAKGRALLERIKNRLPIEVSVGTFVIAEPRNGSFNGKAYSSVWRKIVPDHLALLPEGHTGACSIEMGCGAFRPAEARAAREYERDEKGRFAPTGEGDASVGDEGGGSGKEPAPAPSSDAPKPSLTKEVAQKVNRGVIAAEMMAGEAATALHHKLGHDADALIVDAIHASEIALHGIVEAWPVVQSALSNVDVMAISKLFGAEGKETSNAA